MRKPLFIFTCLILVVAVAVMLTGYWAGTATAPDVKVTFVGVTNETRGSFDADFRVVNRSRQRIRVSEVSVSNKDPFPPEFASTFGKPITLEAGESHMFRAKSFRYLAPTAWRGRVTLNWDTPQKRFHDWLLKQTWQKHLPRKWLQQKDGSYIFSSQWVESPGRNAGAFLDPFRRSGALIQSDPTNFAIGPLFPAVSNRPGTSEPHP